MSTQFNSLSNQVRKTCHKLRKKNYFSYTRISTRQVLLKKSLDEKSKELEKFLDIIGKQDTHHALACNWFLRTSLCFLQADFNECYDKILRNSICKVTKVKMDVNKILSKVRPAVKCGLGVSSTRLLALPAFLASAIGSKSALS